MQLQELGLGFYTLLQAMHPLSMDWMKGKSIGHHGFYHSRFEGLQRPFFPSELSFPSLSPRTQIVPVAMPSELSLRFAEFVPTWRHRAVSFLNC